MKPVCSVIITFSLLLFCVSLSFAQTIKPSVNVSFSFGGNDLFSSPNWVGGPSYQGRGVSGFEANVSLVVLKNLDFVTGFSIMANKFGKTDAPTGSPAITSNVSITVFSIPLYAKYHFLKFLYVSGGPLFNLNSGDRNLSGIGAGGSIGVEYLFNNGLTITFGPFIRIHGLIPEKNYKLLNSGVNFGIGYRF